MTLFIGLSLLQFATRKRAVLRSLHSTRLALVAMMTAIIVNAAAIAKEGRVRVATFNASLNRNHAGQLVRNLAGGRNEQARRIAEVVQRVRPDILLVNEFDFDPAGNAATSFLREYLAVAQNGCEAIEFPHYFIAPVNTGRPSDRDLDKDGQFGEPADAIGFGRHEGQYGMLVLSRFPIALDRVRTFQKFLWRDMPNALLPTDPNSGAAYYDEGDLAVLRLSSKSLFDVPIEVPGHAGAPSWRLHVLASHPTPPVFDGPEDRNGRRNHDEIRLLADYIDMSRGAYLVDDSGRTGGLPPDARFVIAGDLNCDPLDGDGLPGTMDQLLKNPRVNSSFTPRSDGGRVATEQKTTRDAAGKGDPSHDTSSFGDFQNLRIDYVLPSSQLRVIDGGVYWPAPGEPGAEAVTASDHRLVWIEIASH
jgi:endonuclease/exonuclease/phosphatase family metal-dependent hydrolase